MASALAGNGPSRNPAEQTHRIRSPLKTWRKRRRDAPDVEVQCMVKEVAGTLFPQLTRSNYED